jgi:hypothetical protein
VGSALYVAVAFVLVIALRVVRILYGC